MFKIGQKLMINDSIKEFGDYNILIGEIGTVIAAYNDSTRIKLSKRFECLQDNDEIELFNHRFNVAPTIKKTKVIGNQNV